MRGRSILVLFSLQLDIILPDITFAPSGLIRKQSREIAHTMIPGRLRSRLLFIIYSYTPQVFENESYGKARSAGRTIRFGFFGVGDGGDVDVGPGCLVHKGA